MKILRAISTTLILIVAGALMGCGGGSNTVQANGPVVSAPRRFQGLEFTISSDKAVRTFSDHITFNLTMKNISTQPITFSEIDCPFDDAVIKQGNQTVWQYSHDIVCAADNGDLVTTTINPGESRIIPIVWNQKDNLNRDASLGQYTVTAWLNLFILNGAAIDAAQDEASFAPQPITFTLQRN